jgi:hypothetical protein
MKTWQKLAGVAVVLVCVTATGAAVGAAVAAPTGGSRQSAVAGGHAVPDASSGFGVESKFTPITPCRIVDTRSGGGALTGGHARSFLATGTTAFPSQGGTSGGCGIPTAATAIDVSFQSVDSTKTGYVNETAYGTAFSTASLLHYAPKQIIGTGTGTFAFQLKSSRGSTDVLVDVLGYYIAPMTATVNSDGTLLFGSRVVSVTGTTGEYDVQFDRNITGCNYQVSPFVTSSAVIASVGRLDTTTDTLLVETTVGGTLTPEIFYVMVTC